LRLFSFGGYGLALAALALVVFGAYDSYPLRLRLDGSYTTTEKSKRYQAYGRADHERSNTQAELSNVG